MPIKLRTDKRRLVLHPSTVAFITDDRDSPSYPKGVNRFWHNYSLRKNHVHAKWGYSVRDACIASDIDPDELAAKLDAANRARWAAEGPIVLDRQGRLVSGGGLADVGVAG